MEGLIHPLRSIALLSPVRERFHGNGVEGPQLDEELSVRVRKSSLTQARYIWDAGSATLDAFF